MELLNALWEFSFFGLYAGVLAMAIIIRDYDEFSIAIRKQLKHNLLAWLGLGLLLFNLGYVPVNYLRFLVAAGVTEYPPWIRPVLW